MMTVAKTLFTTVCLIIILLAVLILLYTVLGVIILGTILLITGLGLQHVFATLIAGIKDM